MGTGLKAQCTCGYQSDTVIGSTRRDHGRIFYFPHVCRSCMEVVSVNLLAEDVQCPLCSGKDLMIYGSSYSNAKPSRWSKLKNLVRAGSISAVGPQVREGTSIVEESFCFRLDRYFCIDNGVYMCPRCASPGLRFTLSLLFD